MSVFDSSPLTPLVVRAEQPLLDEAHLAAVSFLARYGGRTLESYRADLRQFFQRCHDYNIAPLAATRTHIELYRAWMDERGLAASTVDRRLSTVCGYYRFAHIDGRISANPAQYVRRPRVHPGMQRGMDRGELAGFLYTAERTSTMHAALAVLLGLNGLRVSEACGANIEDLGFERGHRTLQIVGKGNKPAGIPLVPRTARTLDLAIGERSDGPILLRHDGTRLDTPAPHTAGSARSAIEPDSIGPTHTCCAPRSSSPPSTPASRSETYRSPPATPTHAPPPSTTAAAKLRPARCLRRRRLRHQRMTHRGRVASNNAEYRESPRPGSPAPGASDGTSWAGDANWRGGRAA